MSSAEEDKTETKVRMYHSAERTPLVADDDDDDDDHTSWEEGLTPEIRQMTHDADAILESIRQVATTTSPIRESSVQSTKMGRDDDDDYEDDDMDDEIQRLGSLSEEMRKTLDAELRNVESSFRSSPHSPIEESSAGECTTERQPSSPQAQSPDILKGGVIDESLLLATTIIWSIIIFIVVYAKNHLVNEEGRITLPFPWS